LDTDVFDEPQFGHFRKPCFFMTAFKPQNARNEKGGLNYMSPVPKKPYAA